MKEMNTRIIGSAACLVVLMYFTMGHMAGLPVPGWYHGAENGFVAALLQLFLTLPVVYLNRVYYFRGLKALYHRSPKMDSLIAVGSLAALIYGIAALFRMAYGLGHGDMELVKHYLHNLYFESAAMILTLITLGKFLEARAKGKTGDPKALPAEAALMMATVCGARAQGRSAECGVIELGMDADLILLDFNQPHLIPCHNVLSQLVYAASGHDVALTMVRGRILYADGKYPTLDIAGALKELHDYAIPRVFSDEPEAQA